jgi:putative NIF3 family GTP cyclohydrolase 1 type 2
VPWRDKTVDTFKTGNPDTIVKGIATSFGGTLDVIRRAAASGKNLVIVHEPTFYSHEDTTKDLNSDTYRAKQEFIDKNGIVVFRFHDHWHARRPDGIVAGMIDALGWEKYRSEDNPRRYVLPATTLEKLAADIRDRMKIRTLRVVGDPSLPVSRVTFSPGYTNLPVFIRAFDSPDIDVLVMGESSEWTGIELARDTVALGKKKGLIVMGHVPSEESGMKECAKWLKTFVPEVPIEFIPSGEAFWTVR